MKKSKISNLPMKAVLFARVSSREQEQGASIDAQMATIYDYCERKGLPIIKEFTIVESSIKGDRKQYKDMLDFVRHRTEKIAIIVNCVDRLQRSYKDTPALDDLRREGKIEVHFLKENLILHKNSTTTELIFWNMSVLMANSYVLALADNVKRSMHFLWEQGHWTSQAPLGYLNVRNSDGKADVVFDPSRAELVKRLFEEYAKGYMSLQGMVEYAAGIGLTRRNGGKLQRSEINNILHNPFYFGLMTVNDKIYPHVHGTIIDKELFDLVQDTLSGKRRAPNKQPYGSKPFALRGIVRCACGCLMSPEIKKGKYVYLKCSHAKGHCEQRPINENLIMEQIEKEVISKLSIPDEIMDDLQNKVKKALESENEQAILTKRRLDKQIKELKVKESRLVDLLIDGTLTKQAYDSKLEEIKKEQDGLNSLLLKYGQVEQNITRMVSNVVDIAGNLVKYFKSYKPAVKNELLNILLYNCELEGEKARISLQKPFNFLSEKPDCLFWLGRTDSNHDKENQNLLSYH